MSICTERENTYNISHFWTDQYSLEVSEEIQEGVQDLIDCNGGIGIAARILWQFCGVKSLAVDLDLLLGIDQGVSDRKRLTDISARWGLFLAFAPFEQLQFAWRGNEILRDRGQLLPRNEYTTWRREILKSHIEVEYYKANRLGRPLAKIGYLSHEVIVGSL